MDFRRHQLYEGGGRIVGEFCKGKTVIFHRFFLSFCRQCSKHGSAVSQGTFSIPLLVIKMHEIIIGIPALI